jgi:hypothetical protein
MTIKVKLSDDQLDRLAVVLEHRLRLMDTRSALRRIQRRYVSAQRLRRKQRRAIAKAHRLPTHTAPEE